MDFNFDSRTLCYIAVIGLLCCVIACLCCGLFSIVICYCFREHLPCCSLNGGGSSGNAKQRDEDTSPYYPFGNGQPFYIPQNYFCNNGGGGGGGDDETAYSCVAAPMGGQSMNAQSAHMPTTAGGLAKPGSGKKGRVNPLNL